MAILMSVLVGLVAFGMLGMAVYLTVRTNGVFFTEIRYFEIVKGIGGVILFVLLMSFYGGLAGGMLMAIAAVLRKRRHQQALAQDSDA